MSSVPRYIYICKHITCIDINDLRNPWLIESDGKINFNMQEDNCDKVIQQSNASSQPSEMLKYTILHNILW